MSIPKVNIITPVAPYHRPLMQRCADSVLMQTVRCEHLIIEDTDYRGAGWARNRGLEKSAHADFVVFLDADDSIEPNFVERCLDVWQPGLYVYTDWMQGNVYKVAPDRPWRADGAWHVITALMPTQAVIEVDGFDESLIGGEDSLLFWSLTRADCCGIRVPEALFHYGHEGQRAREFVANESAYQKWKDLILGRFKNQMGCCGDNTNTVPDVPSNEPFDGAVLAQAIWSGNRIEYGLVTRRQYPRTGNGKQVWIDPRDAVAAPHLWRVVVEAKDEPKRLHVSDTNHNPAQTVPVMHGVHEIARALFPNAQPAPDVDAMAEIEPVGRGDVSQVLRLAGKP